MTIHSDHPFQVPDGDRRPERRFRGRMPAPVTVVATGTGAARAGLTVSSLVVADGEPARVLALVDEESALAEALTGTGTGTGTAAVSVLAWEQRAVADVFAGLGPSPGGPFRTGSWSDSDWGPVLDHCPAWAGCRVAAEKPRSVGWSLLLELTIEHVGLGDDAQALAHRRGRYLQV